MFENSSLVDRCCHQITTSPGKIKFSQCSPCSLFLGKIGQVQLGSKMLAKLAVQRKGSNWDRTRSGTRIHVTVKLTQDSFPRSKVAKNYKKCIYKQRKLKTKIQNSTIIVFWEKDREAALTSLSKWTLTLMRQWRWGENCFSSSDWSPA